MLSRLLKPSTVNSLSVHCKHLAKLHVLHRCLNELRLGDLAVLILVHHLEHLFALTILGPPQHLVDIGQDTRHTMSALMALWLQHIHLFISSASMEPLPSLS